MNELALASPQALTRTFVVGSKRIAYRKLGDNEILREGDISYLLTTGQFGTEIGISRHGTTVKAYNDKTSVAYRPIKPAPKPKAKGRTTPRISFTGELSQDGGTSFQLPFKNMKKLWPRGIPPARERLVRITLSPITHRKGKK